ncbi:hypothetical protein TELCIR_14077, partial [Teladorsagia circumcincta]
MWAKALLLLVFATYVIADDLQQCLQCVQQNQTWCPETSTCGNTKACQTPITLSLNCPRLPDPAYAYNETNRVPFFDNGHLFKYFHDAFFFLWNGGLEQQVRTLKFQYPDYKFY